MGKKQGDQKSSFMSDEQLKGVLAESRRRRAEVGSPSYVPGPSGRKPKKVSMLGQRRRPPSCAGNPLAQEIEKTLLAASGNPPPIKAAGKFRAKRPSPFQEKGWRPKAYLTPAQAAALERQGVLGLKAEGGDAKAKEISDALSVSKVDILLSGVLADRLLKLAAEVMSEVSPAGPLMRQAEALESDTFHAGRVRGARTVLATKVVESLDEETPAQAAERAARSLLASLNKRIAAMAKSWMDGTVEAVFKANGLEFKKYAYMHSDEFLVDGDLMPSRAEAARLARRFKFKGWDKKLLAEAAKVSNAAKAALDKRLMDGADRTARRLREERGLYAGPKPKANRRARVRKKR